MIKIGKYVIHNLDDGKIWIYREDGKGMEIAESEFIEYLDAMFKHGASSVNAHLLWA